MENYSQLSNGGLATGFLQTEPPVQNTQKSWANAKQGGWAEATRAAAREVGRASTQWWAWHWPLAFLWRPVCCRWALRGCEDCQRHCRSPRTRGTGFRAREEQGLWQTLMWSGGSPKRLLMSFLSPQSSLSWIPTVFKVLIFYSPLIFLELILSV